MGLQANQHKAYLLMKWDLKLGVWLGYIWEDWVLNSVKISSITNTVCALCRFTNEVFYLCNWS